MIDQDLPIYHFDFQPLYVKVGEPLTVRTIVCMKEDHKMKSGLFICMKMFNKAYAPWIVAAMIVIVMKGLYKGCLYFLYLLDMPLFM